MNKSILNSLNFWQELYHSIQFGIIILDPNGQTLLSNQWARNILNLSEKHLSNTNFSSLDPSTWSKIKDTFQSGIPQVGQRVQFQDKTLFLYQSPIWLSGEIKALALFFHDYLDLEKHLFKYQDTYKNHNKELNIIFESTYDGLYITDGQGFTLRVNKSWERITGLKPEDVLGKNTADLEKQGYVSKFVSPIVIKEKKPISTKARTMTNRQVLVSGNPVFNDQGNVEMVVTTVRDLTDIQNLSRELKTAQKKSEEYRKKFETLQQQLMQEEDIVAHSKAMRDIVSMAIQTADVKTPILITGETGVGKEVVAKLFHKHNSFCSKGPFLKINCGAIPDSLLEPELFGYEPGAFTNANPKGKPGLLELAEGGTLVLDEIGELSSNVQAKLLAVLQDHEIIRVGGIKSRKIDLRFIFITNRNLESMVKNKEFREDLYYRMNVIPVHVPPLRERKEEIIPLINSFVQKFTKKYNKNVFLSREAIDSLYRYSWPGNVRELSHLMERFVVLHNNKEIQSQDLPFNINKDLFTNLFDTQFSLKQAVKKFESKFIKRTIEKSENTKEAAAKLGIDQSTLYRKLKAG